jgi:formylmethanofuran dehydrogenase subunit E
VDRNTGVCMNFVKEPKSRTLNKELERAAIEFHGHDGPFMTIGLRMGLIALEMLDCKGWFDLSCEARLNWNPPDSCVIDGIQSSTGCTMGKKNISVVEQEGIETHFKSNNKTLIIRLKPELIEEIKEKMTDEDIPHEIMEELEKADIKKIFDIELIK